MRKICFFICIWGFVCMNACSNSSKHKSDSGSAEFWHGQESLNILPFSLWEKIVADSIWILDTSPKHKTDTLLLHLFQMSGELESKAPEIQDETKHQVDEARKDISKAIDILNKPAFEVSVLKKLLASSWLKLSLYHQELAKIYLQRHNRDQVAVAWEESLNYLEQVQKWQAYSMDAASKNMYKKSLQELVSFKNEDSLTDQQIHKCLQKLNLLILNLFPSE